MTKETRSQDSFRELDQEMGPTHSYQAKWLKTSSWGLSGSSGFLWNLHLCGIGWSRVNMVFSKTDGMKILGLVLFISQLYPSFSPMLLCRVGDGTRFCFWEDHWISHPSFLAHSLCLGQLSLLHNASISKFLVGQSNHPSWNILHSLCLCLYGKSKLLL